MMSEYAEMILVGLWMSAVASPLLVGFVYVLWRVLREIRKTGKRVLD